MTNVLIANVAFGSNTSDIVSFNYQLCCLVH